MDQSQCFFLNKINQRKCDALWLIKVTQLINNVNQALIHIVVYSLKTIQYCLWLIWELMSFITTPLLKRKSNLRMKSLSKCLAQVLEPFVMDLQKKRDSLFLVNLITRSECLPTKMTNCNSSLHIEFQIILKISLPKFHIGAIKCT